MPPKKNGDAPGEAVDGTTRGAVTALCHLCMSCDDFQADNSKLAPILGIAQARNVPRKINSIINQYGFEFKGGKITQTGNQAPAVTAGPSNNTGSAKGGKDYKTIKAPIGLKSNVKARQGPAPKKRKLAVNFHDEDDSDRAKEEDGEEV